MSEAQHAPARQPSVLLIVSICLNIALIALVAIAMTRVGARRIEPHERKGGLSAQAVMRAAPAEESKIKAIIEEHRPRLRRLRGEAMGARAESYRLLTAPDFNAQEYAKSLAAVQAADAALEKEVTEMAAQSVATLTPAERADFAKTVKRPDKKWLRRLMRGR
ncbi:MAG TPA: periplasmic heavy metal sensor [Rhizomicrobium sp.]|nr:periplasmic heavy metal sensor [Rhizomicrobium sp.]